MIGFLRRHLELGTPLKISLWRQVSMGLWKNPAEASVHGVVELDVGPVLSYIDRLREASGEKITLSHILCKAAAKVFSLHPEFNCLLRWGRFYPRKNLNIFFQVATDPQGRDLSGLVICDPLNKSLVEIAREMEGKVRTIRSGKDPSYGKIKWLLGHLPRPFIRLGLAASSFVLFTLNLWTPLLGLPRDPFGSIMITNIGSLGPFQAFAPLIPSSKVPIIISMGHVREVPTIKDNQLILKKVLSLFVTFDHRYVDGAGVFLMEKDLEKIFAHPEEELDIGKMTS